ncbi:bZIP transcription factor TRAB1-like [Gastrolobium bilobum]|uniref:bZIP transcription factor TRAB1-like n=1 Tax=Gastrolobium bilobum TaxID=150636 RepID=UPI002AB1F9C0|nr:bZIP transcription factor TRAB1-like [Gastrolobium bilobum]
MDVVSPNRDEGSQYPTLVREGSFYNLTFDEGNKRKPLHSMNLDELLRNVISAENGSQLVTNHDSFLLGNINLNGTLTNKTINEVCREIVQQEHVKENHSPQQSSFGEMTLEDFLGRDGMINIGKEDNVIGDVQTLMGIDPMVIGSQPEDWLPLQMQTYQHQHQQQQQHHEKHQQQIMGLCPDFGVSKYENTEIGYTVPITCSDSKKRSRYSDEMLEKTIERRQKRMAKNRESAARSRAKKQEHINKLENEKFRLQKEISLLKTVKGQRQDGAGGHVAQGSKQFMLVL